VSFTTGYGLGRLLGAPVVDPARRAAGRAPAHALAAAGLAGALVVGLALPGRVVPPRRPPALAAEGTTIGRRTLAALHHPASVPPVAVSPARIEAIEYPTPSLGGTRLAYVVLPPGYDSSRRHYPVVELLHGRPGSPNDVIAGLDPIGAESLPGVPPFIAVVPDGHGPAVADGDFADTARQQLGAAVSEDLRAWVDRHYRTAGPWSVGGLSSGGYGAAYLASRPAGGYGAVCSLSGNFVPEGPAFRGQPASVLRADSPLLHVRAGGARVLLVAGASDRPCVRQAEEYAAALTRAGQYHQLDIVPGGHTWAVWSGAFPACLRFMLGAPPAVRRAPAPGPATAVAVAARPLVPTGATR
jgi:enterochelin esterase-like enzyme